MARNTVHRTTVMSWLFASVLIGLGLCQAGLHIVSAWLLLPLFIISVGAILHKSYAACIIVVIAGAGMGITQGTAFQQSVMPYRDYVGKTVVIEGLIKEDPTYSKNAAKQFSIEQIIIVQDGHRLRLTGDLFISTPSSPDITRHDRVRVTGKLKAGFGPFQGSVSYGQVQVIGHEQNVFDHVRSRFAAGVIAVLPEPHASLGLGFVIGMKASLPPDMNLALQELSLTHMVVASGYNLTVLVRVAKRLRQKQSRLQTLLLSVGLIMMFLMITGNSPSMVRAGLVSGISLVAWYYGRQMKPLIALLLVMSATAFAYPPYLWGDIGWWLSFSAFAGILLVVPLVTSTVWREGEPPIILQIALEAFISELITLPIILLFFGNLSILGLLANVLIVPLIPLAMLLVAIAGFMDMALPAVAAFIAVPAHALLALIVWMVYIMSAVPWASIEVHISALGLVLWYSMMGIAVAISWAKLSRQQRRQALQKQII